MDFNFSKYQGTGNDFILIDNRYLDFPKETSPIQRLCDRKFGIGADGLILIESHPDHDYKMVYFNADGTQSLCGNGSRCAFAFAKALNIVNHSATFEAIDGVHSIKKEDGKIHFSLFDLPLSISETNGDYYLDTGSPHYVRFVDDVETQPVVEEGRKIRNLSAYSSQNGTNVNFAQLLKDRVKIRTYERGVENETLSCGTGATAVALVASQQGLESPITIETRGGDLLVYFEIENEFFRNIWLAGPAEKVFDGTISL